MKKTAVRYNYAWEQFYSAVRHMTRSKQSLQDRLGDAYASHLVKLVEGIRARDGDLVPPEISEVFERLAVAMSRHHAKGDEGNIHASARALSDDEASELIASVVSMYDHVAKYGPNAEE